MHVGTLSYGLAAVGFAVLALLLLIGWRGRVAGALLTISAGVSAVWSAFVAYQIAIGRPAWLALELLELARTVLWLAFLLTVMAYASAKHAPFRRAVWRMGFVLAAFCVVLVGVTVFRAGAVVNPFAMPDLFTDVVGRLLLALFGLVLVHQLYFSVPADKRWSIKFLCLGAGGVFVYDFYLYSDAMLFRRLDVTIWDARGIANALVVPLIAVAAARNRDWSLEVSVSRRVVFHSAALVGAAVYFLIMAAAGYYIRFFGGQWGPVFQITFLFGAVVLLGVVLFSGAARARLKIFLSQHFFSYRYDYRLEWLRFTQTLSAGEWGVGLRGRSIQAIAELVESPGGSLWLRQDSGNFERVAHWNMDGLVGRLDADSAFAKFLERHDGPLDLHDYRAHPERYDPGLVPEFISGYARAWLVVPLILQEQLVGFIVLMPSRGGGVVLDWEVSDLLKTAGRQAASYLAHLEAAKALMAAKQFDSFNRMSAFVIHDLKNLVAQLSLLMANAEKHKHNPEFQQEMLETVGHSVDKMKRLLAQLKANTAVPEPPTALTLDQVVRQAIAQQAGFPVTPQLELEGPVPQVLASRDRLTRVVGHLIRNAVEATPADGRVTVRVGAHDKFAVVTVSDTGQGMSEAFMREKLFRPFESTKQNGMGVGVYECKQYVEELGGRLAVESEPGQGATFRLWLPRLAWQPSTATASA